MRMLAAHGLPTHRRYAARQRSGHLAARYGHVVRAIRAATPPCRTSGKWHAACPSAGSHQAGHRAPPMLRVCRWCTSSCTRPANAPPIRGKAEIRPPGGKVWPCCACSYITLQDIRQVACSLSRCWLTSSWTPCPPHAACVQVVHELMHTASGNKEFMQALAAKAHKP